MCNTSTVIEDIFLHVLIEMVKLKNRKIQTHRVIFLACSVSTKMRKGERANEGFHRKAALTSSMAFFHFGTERGEGAVRMPRGLRSQKSQYCV